MNSIDILKEHLPAAQVIIEGCAYLGSYTKELFDAYPNADIHAFDAHNFACSQIKRVVKDDPRVRITTAALGNISGTRFMHLHSAPYYDSLLLDNPEITKVVGRMMTTPVGRSVVNVITIDDYCLQNGIHDIDLIKLDCQGYELKALEGAKDHLAWTKMIQVKLIHAPLYLGQPDRDEIVKYLERFGFQQVDFAEGQVGIDGRLQWNDAFFGRQA